jgi:glyoxylase-like metal-dependent hydrolase (beta-lactamase superfamily II)
MIRQLSVGPIGQNVYIVEREGAPVVIVDPGADAPLILEETLAALGRSSGETVYIACTHGHLDHVAALGELLGLLRAKGFAPRAYAPLGDRDYFGERAEELNRRVFQGIHAMGYFNYFWRPIPEADEYFGEGFELPGTGMVAIHTPGHTPGSSCFLVEADGALISGDTLFNAGRGRTDNFDSDESDILSSIRDKLCRLPEALRVWPGHGEATTIGNEKGLYR